MNPPGGCAKTFSTENHSAEAIPTCNYFMQSPVKIMRDELKLFPRPRSAGIFYCTQVFTDRSKCGTRCGQPSVDSAVRINFRSFPLRLLHNWLVLRTSVSVMSP